MREYFDRLACQLRQRRPTVAGLKGWLGPSGQAIIIHSQTTRVRFALPAAWRPSCESAREHAIPHPPRPALFKPLELSLIECRVGAPPITSIMPLPARVSFQTTRIMALVTHHVQSSWTCGAVIPRSEQISPGLVTKWRCRD